LQVSRQWEFGWAFAAALSQQRSQCSTQQPPESAASGYRPEWLEQDRHGARPEDVPPPGGVPRPVVHGAPVRGRWSRAVPGSPKRRARRLLRSDAWDAQHPSDAWVAQHPSVAQHRSVRGLRGAVTGGLACPPALGFPKPVLPSPDATAHCRRDRAPDRALGCREPAVHGPLEAALRDSPRRAVRIPLSPARARPWRSRRRRPDAGRLGGCSAGHRVPGRMCWSSALRGLAWPRLRHKSMQACSRPGGQSAPVAAASTRPTNLSSSRHLPCRCP